MPVNGERVDELLSGYLDGGLSDAESAELHEALEDAAVGARLAELQTLRNELRALRDVRQRSAPGLSEGFAASVWESIQRQQVELPRSVAPSVATQVRSTRQRSLWIAVTLTASAVLLLLVFQQLSDPWGATTAKNGDAEASEVSDESRNVSDDENGSPTIADARPDVALPAAQEAVNSPNPFGERLPESNLNNLVEQAPEGRLTNDGKQWENQLMMTLVVDMALSKEAVEKNYLSDAFAAQGIPLKLPMIADAETLEVLTESRMVGERAVTDVDQKDEALLYFVHADMLQVDRLVQGFIEDFDNVRKLRTDAAFETQVNSFLRQLVATAGEEFGVSETFAAQVQMMGTQPNAPLTGIGPQGMLVGSSERGKSRATSQDAVSQLEAKSTVLLLVRLPN